MEDGEELETLMLMEKGGYGLKRVVREINCVEVQQSGEEIVREEIEEEGMRTRFPGF